MITLQDLDGNVKLYKCLLKNIKSKVSVFKRRSIKEISKKDVSFVRHLPELECLELSGIEGDISPILQCYNLQQLDVSYTAIDSVEQFKVLPMLRELTARGCGLKGIIDFSGFPQLKEVELIDNDFTYEQQKEMKKRCPNIKMKFEERSTVY